MGDERSTARTTGEPFLFELSWTADGPVPPDLHTSVASFGSRRTLDCDITLLDSPDHRLLRAGVVVAHRVVDGLGEWYMDAPAWSPWLPVSFSVALDAAGDLPQDFGCLVRTFLRGATLAPVAALSWERTETVLEAADSTELALIRDDRISVVQSGVTTSRVRELTITPYRILTDGQREWMSQRILALGGVPVTRHPSVLRRLGPSAGALSDYPRREHHPGEGMQAWLSAQLSQRLREVIEADLAARSQGMDLGCTRTDRTEPRILPESPDRTELVGIGWDPVTSAAPSVHDVHHGPIRPLQKAVHHLAKDLDAMSGLLEPAWVARMLVLCAEIKALDPERVSIHGLPRPYYQLLEEMTAGARSPRLVVDPDRPARATLKNLLVESAEEVVTRCDEVVDGFRADPSGDSPGWGRAYAVVGHTLAVTGIVDTHRSERIERRLRPLAPTLRRAARKVDEFPDLAALSSEEAFEAGRRFERRLDGVLAARRDFAEDWPRRRKRLDKAIHD